MPTFNCTMIFNAGRYGWSESWYLFAASHVEAMSRLDLLAQARTPMLGNSYHLEALRVSDVAVRGDALLKPFFGIEWLQASKITDTPDAVWLGWMYRVSAGNTSHRESFLRGMPDSYFSNPASVSQVSVAPSQALDKAFTQFRLTLLQLGFQMKVLRRAGNLPVDIIGATAGLPGVTELTLRAPGITQPDFFNSIVIYGGKSLPGLRGKKKIEAFGSPPATNLHIYYTFPSGGLYLGDATAIASAYDYVNITDVQLLRIGKRDTGRAFFTTRGRASDRVC